MSLVDSEPIDFLPTACRNRHPLRRMMAGELSAAESASLKQHLEGCSACQAVMRELQAEDAEVRKAVPLAQLQEKLLAKSEPAPSNVVPLRRLSKIAPVVALALAAGLAALILAPRTAVQTAERTKGGLGLDVFVGGVGEPRRVDARELALAPGERVQLKVHGEGRRYVAVVSVDDAGSVTPIYFAGEQSLPLEGREMMLPQSIDFTGRGHERLIVLLSDEPLLRTNVEQAARAAFASAGGLAEMKPLTLDGHVDELDRTVLKPEAQ
ncbi:MAG: DUF4384 domain-containing protein [Deltaproteobacteria bacterium]|nr:DUF4384 domain-containing protein [Deltaproteobacteria bacterium]